MAWQPRFQHQGGELLIDHRASPGLPADVARAAGFDPSLAGEGKLLELPTLTCCHCKNSFVKNLDRVRPRENCPKCGNHYLCDLCYAQTQHPDYVHMPYEQFRDDTLDGKPPMVLGTSLGLLRLPAGKK